MEDCRICAFAEMLLFTLLNEADGFTRSYAPNVSERFVDELLSAMPGSAGDSKGLGVGASNDDAENVDDNVLTKYNKRKCVATLSMHQAKTCYKYEQ